MDEWMDVQKTQKQYAPPTSMFGTLKVVDGGTYWSIATNNTYYKCLMFYSSFSFENENIKTVPWIYLNHTSLQKK